MQANKTITLLNVCSAGREATRSQFVCPFLGVDHTREVKLWRTRSQDVEFALLRDANVFLLLCLLGLRVNGKRMLILRMYERGLPPHAET